MVGGKRSSRTYLSCCRLHKETSHGTRTLGTTVCHRSAFGQVLDQWFLSELGGCVGLSVGGRARSSNLLGMPTPQLDPHSTVPRTAQPIDHEPPLAHCRRGTTAARRRGAIGRRRSSLVAPSDRQQAVAHRMAQSRSRCPLWSCRWRFCQGI